MRRESSPHEERPCELPASPAHGFVGRENEFSLASESLLEHRCLVLRGEHGEGKTTLAVELARRWLTMGRVAQVAYLSLEVHHDGPGLRFSLGQQLVPSFQLAASQDYRLALQLLERVLRDSPTLVIFDALEAVLPRSESSSMDPRIYEPTVLDRILVLASELRNIGRTYLVLASAEAVPEPFSDRELELGGLDDAGSFNLLAGVLSLRESAHELSRAQALPLAHRVGCHAGSLVALAREASKTGVDEATRVVDQIEAAVGGLAPADGGNRLRWLALGAEIALRGLPGSLREKLPLLDVFRGGGHLTAIAAVLDLDVEGDEEVRLAEHLIDAGLAEMLPCNYLRFHPALRAALRAEASGRRIDDARRSWIEATTQLVEFLCQEQIKSPQLATLLTQLDLRNLLACLEFLADATDADQVVDFANAVEALVGPLARPEALARIDQLRERASELLSDWSHERYLAESSALELLMDAGRPDETVTMAQRLLHRAELVGAEAYAGADYDIANLHLTLGLARLMAGEGDLASTSCEEARLRFHRLAESGLPGAAQMEAQALARTGDALRATGLRAPSGEAYLRAIALAEQLEDWSLVAEVKTQVGGLCLAQGRIAKALAAYEEARDHFMALGEPMAVAGIWHQIGLVHQSSGRLDAAIDACRQALDLELAAADRGAAATTLGELGELLASKGATAEAVDSFRGAADVFGDLDDLEKEGIARSQMADKLIRLSRFDQARVELLRTIECDAPFGHEVQPWRTYSMLSHLEEKVGRAEARDQARYQAIQAYLRFRRDGGECQVGHGEIFSEATQAILNRQTAEVTAKLDAMLGRKDLPAALRALIPSLLAVLGGSRDRQLAADPNLYYRDAAELLLQLEQLEGSRGSDSGVFF